MEKSEPAELSLMVRQSYPEDAPEERLYLIAAAYGLGRRIQLVIRSTTGQQVFLQGIVFGPQVA